MDAMPQPSRSSSAMRRSCASVDCPAMQVVDIITLSIAVSDSIEVVELEDEADVAAQLGQAGVVEPDHVVVQHRSTPRRPLRRAPISVSSVFSQPDGPVMITSRPGGM